MRYSWWSWGVAGVLAVCASTSARTYASCVGSSTVELLWSYPAEGESDVPTNAQLQLVFNTKLLGTDWDATLNGEPIARSSDGAFAVDALAPDTAYTFRIEGHQPRATDVMQVVELHFRTGSAFADVAGAPEVGEATSTAPRDMAGMCERVDALYNCRDTLPTDVREVALAQPTAVAWVDDAGNVWPRSCPPRVDVLIADRCYNMHALSADGRVSEPSEFCSVPAAMNVVEPASSSCAVAAVGGAGRELVQVPACLVFLALALRRSQRRTRGAR